ncbi:Sad1 / UNC-like C-terminal [Nesidiocoris tenuis]|uniref:Sad1 / UNC-like C-terminal n=1 Tax=Nesidiocoris tenuis TaxID=355587 RepID=A0ABN7B7C2_9HEMI|nr:Sad1 / UNC-like C-terminal [Nesidiocoris tenuis]
MSGDSVFSKLNGSGGFVKFNESLTLTSVKTTKVLKSSSKTNGSECATRLSDETCLSSRPPDDGREYVFRHGRWWPKETVRVVDYYKSFGDWFNKFPKTDYLYSPSSPWYGTEVAPGIPRIPNMCRPSYRTHREEHASFRGSFRSLFTANQVRRETWTELCRRWVRTTTTTVETVMTTTMAIVSLAFVTVASRLSFSSSSLATADRGGTSSRAWLLLFLFLLVPLFCYPAYKSGALDSQNMSARASSLYESFSPLMKPYFALWDGLKYLADQLLRSIRLLPSLVVEFVAALYEVLYSFIETDFGPSGVQKIPIEATTVRKEEHHLDRSSDQMELLNQMLELKSAMTLLNSKNDETLTKLRVEFERKFSELEAAIKSISTRVDEGDTAKIQSAAALTKTEGPGRDVDLVELVQGMIDLYHADRTGKTDYALASNGASIASIRCTRPFDKRPRQYDIWGIVFWNHVNPPDVIIKSGHLPGECWAFEGANGYVVIQLSVPIFVTGFSLEHTPKELTPHGNIESAPKQFSVWGLKSVDDKEEESLGRFEFLDNGKSLQTYDAIIVDKPFQLVELRIESNHGHMEYTCLYRFRVHGRPVPEPQIRNK